MIVDTYPPPLSAAVALATSKVKDPHLDQYEYNKKRFVTHYVTEDITQLHADPTEDT